MRRYLRSPIAIGVFWSGVSSASFQVLSLIAIVLTGRLLGPSGFGAFSIAQNALITVNAFIGPAFSLAAAVLVAGNRNRESGQLHGLLSTFWVATLAVATIVSIGLFVSSEMLAVHMFGNRSLELPLQWCAIAVFFALTASTQVGILLGLSSFRSIATINTIRGLVLLSATLLIVRPYGVVGALAAILVANVVWCLGNHRAIARLTGLSLHDLFTSADRQIAGKILSFGVPAVLQAVVAPAAIAVANSLFSRAPNGLFELGIFNAANTWRYAILFVPQAVSQPLISFLSTAKGAGDARRYSRILITGLAVTVTVATAGGLFVIFARGPLTAAYGADYRQMATLLPVISAAAVISAIGVSLSGLIYTLDMMWTGVGLNIVWGVTFLAAIALLLPNGAEGLAWSYFAASAVQVAVTVIVALMTVSKLDSRIKRTATDLAQRPMTLYD